MKKRKLFYIILGALLSATTVFAQSQEVKSNEQNIATQQTEQNTESFRIRPENPNTIDNSRILVELKPGESTKESIIISNEADISLKIKIYAVDTKISDLKQLTPKYENEPKLEVGKWVKFEKTDQEFELKPSSEKKITLSINVPADAKFNTYKGYIIAQKQRLDKYKNIIITRIAYPVSVTITDTPKEIPHLYNNSPSPYLIGSIIIFVLCIGYYIYEHKKEKKHDRHKEQNKV